METSVSQQTSHKQRTTVRTLITCCSYCFHLFTWTIHGPRPPRLLLFCTILPYCSADDTPSSNHNQEDETDGRGNTASAWQHCALDTPLLLSYDFTVSISWHLAQDSLPSPKVGDNRTRLGQTHPGLLETEQFDLHFNTKYCRFICERYKLTR